MKILLASTAIDEIQWAAARGLVDGVLVTPSLLADAGDDGDGREVVAEICRGTSLPVAALVTHVDPVRIYRDGRELSKVSDQVLVQIPFVEDALEPIRRLASDGVRVVATLVFSGAQALLASKIGASAVVTHVQQLEAQGEDPAAVMQAMRATLDAHDRECDVVAAFVRSTAQFTAIAVARADAVAVDVATLRSLLLHPLTDRGIDLLLGDLSRRPRPRPVP